MVKREKMNRIGWFFVAGAVWAVAVAPGQARAFQASAGPSIVVTSGVFEGEFSDLQTFVGSVEAVRQTTIGSAVEGRVGAVHFERGNRVLGNPNEGATGDADGGDILVEIETATLQIEIETAKIQLSLAEQIFEELKITLPLEIELAIARVAETSARRNSSQNEYERLRRISTQSNAISQTELDQAESQFTADQQLAVQAEVDLRRLEGTSELRLLQAARRVDAARQELIRLEDQKTKYTIRAPFDGYVVAKLTEVGAWISRGDPVMELVALDSVDFSFSVPQEYVGRIQQALGGEAGLPEVSISVEGLSDPLPGELLAVVPQVDLRSRLIVIRARVKNPLIGGVPFLKPGMLGRASLAVGKKRKMHVLSRDALVLGGAKPVVFKVDRQGGKTSVVPVEVTLGANFGDWVEVRGPLVAGDQVVVEGNERLKTGTEIRITKTRDNRPQFQ